MPLANRSYLTMSFPYQNIQAFIQLVKTQSSLLSEPDKMALKQLSETLPETIEAIRKLARAAERSNASNLKVGNPDACSLKPERNEPNLQNQA